MTLCVTGLMIPLVVVIIDKLFLIDVVDFYVIHVCCVLYVRLAVTFTYSTFQLHIFEARLVSAWQRLWAFAYIIFFCILYCLMR